MLLKMARIAAVNYAIEVASQPFWLSWDDGCRGR
jgi:hypothetical protein